MSGPAPAHHCGTPLRRRRSRTRRLLTQLGIALAVLTLAEVGLRVAGLGAPPTQADPYVGFATSRPLFVHDTTGNFLQTAPYKLGHFNQQRFPVRKGADTLRIFCLGGSTTYGRPYADLTSFPGWLRELLPLADPTRHWEVINAGGISYASYRVAAVMEELTGYDPDLFVVYTGHNEFLEERTYGELRETPGGWLALGSALHRSALFSWAQRLTGSEPAAPGPPRGGSLLPGEVEALLDSSVGLDAYTRDDGLKAGVLGHLRLNLERMAEMARGAGAALVFVTPASQLADCRPFKSEHSPGLSADRAQAIDELLARVSAAGTELLTDPETVSALAAATRDDPRHALAWYERGHSLLAGGAGDEAAAALRRARDEDIVPLRALSDVSTIVTEVAAATAVPCLDWETQLGALAQARTGAAAPGADFFLDHVHSTIDVYRQLAVALINTFSTAGLLTLSSTWTESGRAAVEAEVLAAVDPEARVRALTRLAAVLDWAGKHDEARPLTEQALALSGGGDAMSLWQEGNYRRADGNLDGAAESYRAALTIDTEYLEAQANLAATLLALGRLEEAAEAFERSLQLDPDHLDSHFGLGIVLDAWGRRRESRNAFRRVIRLDPGHVDALNQLGISLLRDEDTVEAEKAFRGAVLADPGSLRAHFNLGILLSGTGRVEESQIEYRTVVNADPGHASAWHRLGLAQAILGELQDGVASLERAVQLAPDDARYRQDLERARTRSRFAPPGGR